MLLGTLTTTDPDPGETFTYTILNGLDDTFFALGGSGDDLYFDAGILNFESKATYAINVEVKDSTGLQFTELLTVSINDISEALTLSTTATDPTFNENGGQVGLFSGTNIDVIDTGDRMQTLVITADSISNGNDEKLVVDGEEIELIHLNTETTITNGYDVSVVVTGNTATVTITKPGGYTATEANLLIDGLAYNNSSENPLGSLRDITLALIQDDGDGPDTQVVGIASQVVVQPVNDGPTATIIASAIGVGEDDPPRPVGGVSISDVDAGTNDLEVRLSVNNGVVTLGMTTGLSVTGGANGSASVTVRGMLTNLNNALASLTYQPDPDFSGSDLLTLSVDDLGNTGGGSLTDIDTAPIIVTPGNDAPTVSGVVTGGGTEDDSVFAIDLLSGASDPDTGDVLNVSGLTLSSGDDSGVTIGVNSLSVDPNAYNSLAVGESEVVVYNYNIFDGEGGSVTQTATITITGDNDDPTVSVAVADGGSEDDAVFAVDLLAGASDPDTGDVLNVSGLTLFSGDDSGVTIGVNSLSVDPNAYNSLAVGESEVIVYNYNIIDGNGGLVAQTATISISGSNEDPIVSGVITAGATEDDSVLAVDLLSGASDPDITDTLNVNGLTLSSGDDSGVTIGVNSLSVDPSAYNSLAVGDAEVIVYNYNIIDGEGGSVAQTATITITGLNDGPTVSGVVTDGGTEDDAVFAVDLLADASDPDTTDVLNVMDLTLISGNDGGITIGTNDLSVDPAFYNYLSSVDSEVIVYNYNIIDGEGGSVAQTATITILGANEDPVISGVITVSATEDDSPFAVDLLSGCKRPRRFRLTERE